MEKCSPDQIQRQQTFTIYNAQSRCDSGMRLEARIPNEKKRMKKTKDAIK